MKAESIVKYIEAPTDYDGNKASVFLAGGISECSNWQREITQQLAETDLVILNPRRANFSMDDQAAAQEQIAWEYRHLRRASLVAFWFPPETLCPIAMFELGGCTRTPTPLVVGVHPDYQRKRDIDIQLQLARPEVTLVYDVSSLATAIKDWARDVAMTK